jgi:hypothetical protein
MRTKNCVFIAVVFTLLFGGYSLAEGAEEKMGLLFNEDSTHFYGGRPAEEMTIEGLHKFIDQYADTQISQMFFCVTAMRTSYDSDVWDNRWENYDVNELKALKPRSQFRPEDELAAVKQWDREEAVINYQKSLSRKVGIRNAWLLNERGIDPYKVWTERCREIGISPAVSMRMNDVHGTTNIQGRGHSEFWRQHPEYWRVVPANESPIVNHWERAFDYEHKEVRDYSMSLIRELLERYDIDAIELDWMRDAYVFQPGREKIGLDILTGFMREVRQLTKDWSAKRGHPIQLTVRVPATPQIAKGFGLDTIRWAKEDLIDMLVVSPYVITSDFDIPIELWRQLLAPEASDIKIAVCMEGRLQASYWGTIYNFSSGAQNVYEVACGFAAAMLDRGADHIYLFNYFAHYLPENSNYYSANREYYKNYISTVGKMDTVIDKPRRHPVTFRVLVAPGEAVTHLLPTTVRQEPRQFRIYSGPKPTTGKTIIRVGLDKAEDPAETKLVAKLNSVLCKPIEDNKSPKKFFSARVAQFEVPLDAMQRGYNLVEVAAQKNDDTQNIVWVEIYIVP